MKHRRLTTEQKQEWQDALLATQKLKDGLGMPVDEQVLETVTIFRLMGFTTTGSCAGHLERVTGGPYINFESPKAMRLAAQLKLLEMNSPKRTELRKEAIRLSMLEVQKLIPYLEAFYADRKVPYINRLIVRTFPMTYNCLKCQGSELMHVADKQVRRTMLDENRAEMAQLTEFLKLAYFG